MFTVSISKKGGPPRLQEYGQDEITIGRANGNDLVLPGANISKRHAKIVFNPADKSFVVIDNGSTNGTVINGIRLSQPYDLNSGDKIYIGDFILVLSPGDRSAAPAPQPRRSTGLEAFAGDPTVAAEPGPGAAGDDGDWDFDAPTRGPTSGSDDWVEEPGWEEAGGPTRKPTAVQDNWGGQGDEWGDAALGSKADTPAPAQDEWSSPTRNEELPQPSATTATPQPHAAATPAARPNAHAMPVAEAAEAMLECLQRYIDIDEHYRVESFGKPCTCGTCLLCEAKRAAQAMETQYQRGRGVQH